jgi:hypothetical protein
VDWTDEEDLEDGAGVEELIERNDESDDSSVDDDELELVAPPGASLDSSGTESDGSDV